MIKLRQKDKFSNIATHCHCRRVIAHSASAHYASAHVHRSPLDCIGYACSPHLSAHRTALTKYSPLCRLQTAGPQNRSLLAWSGLQASLSKPPRTYNACHLPHPVLLSLTLLVLALVLADHCIPLVVSSIALRVSALRSCKHPPSGERDPHLFLQYWFDRGHRGVNVYSLGNSSCSGAFTSQLAQGGRMG